MAGRENLHTNEEASAVDKHVVKKYEVLDKLGKGVRSSHSLPLELWS